MSKQPKTTHSAPSVANSLTAQATGQGSCHRTKYTYDAFGIQIASSGTSANNYKYTGEQWDNDLGLYYLRARYFNPHVGRFWTLDTFEGDKDDPLSLHRYLYCQGNPVNRIDPSGQFDLISTLGSLSQQAYLRGSLFIITRPILSRAAGLVIGATLMSALDLDPDALQGLPGFQGLGALEAGEVKLLAAVKRGPVYSALTASLKGMLSREDGLAFQRFLEKKVLVSVQAVNRRVSQVTKHEVDFVLDKAVVEAKTTAAIDAEQLRAIAAYAKDQGKQFWYVFLENPGKAAINKVKQAGGKVGWFLDETDK